MRFFKGRKKNEKRLFLIFGILNFLVTNFVLQISLLILPILIATILSQIVNAFIGFYLYGKKVFKFGRLNIFTFKKYILLALSLWILNYSFIQSLFYYGINKNFAALIIIPFLVSISFLGQKYFVFN